MRSTELTKDLQPEHKAAPITKHGQTTESERPETPTDALPKRIPKGPGNKQRGDGASADMRERPEKTTGTPSTATEVAGMKKEGPTDPRARCPYPGARHTGAEHTTPHPEPRGHTLGTLPRGHAHRTRTASGEPSRNVSVKESHAARTHTIAWASPWYRADLGW